MSEIRSAGSVDVSVVLPVYNQAEQLPTIVSRARGALQGLCETREILLVVNGGGNTLAVAQELAREDDDVRVVTSDRGWGAAVLAGLAAARGSIICYTNSARTQQEDLRLALRYGEINDRAVVKASRKQRNNILRRLGSVIYNFECRMLFGLAVWDINGTPKVFHRNILPDLALTERGDLIDLELCARCRQKGIPVVEVPVYDTTRIAGKATTNLRSALRMYTRPLLMRRRMNAGEGAGRRADDAAA